MAKHVWSIISNKAVVDNHTNNLSLFDVLERITISGPGPAKYKKGSTIIIPFIFSITTLWTRSVFNKPEIVNTRATLFAPDKKSLYRIETEIDLLKYQNRRNILNFRQFHLKGPGVYNFKIDLERKKNSGNAWQNVANLPIEVIFDLEGKLTKTQKGKTVEISASQ